MTWYIADQPAGYQPIETTSSTQKHPLGTVVRARDSATGSMGEFIYLTGVTSTVAGSIVSYNTSSFQTTLLAVGAGVPLPVGVAMSANVGSSYGWYQISGLAEVKKASATSLAAGIALGGNTGVVIAAATANAIQGAVVATVASATSGTAAGFVTVMLQRPAIAVA